MYQTISSKSSYRCLSVVPLHPQWDEMNSKNLPEKKILSSKEVAYLESVSLVQYKNTAIEKSQLEDVIRFADSLQLLNTDHVEPMSYVHENESLYLRPDVITEFGCTKDVLKNAKYVEEDYFVAPPGNVAFLDSNKDINKSNKQEFDAIN